ncbi:hypothetical protein HK405_007018, partial [Cladochytrium tenue]
MQHSAFRHLERRVEPITISMAVGSALAGVSLATAMGRAATSAHANSHARAQATVQQSIKTTHDAGRRSVLTSALSAISFGRVSAENRSRYKQYVQHPSNRCYAVCGGNARIMLVGIVLPASP